MADPFYGESVCVETVKSTKNACANFAYYKNPDGKYLCGVHSKKDNRITLLKNPDREKNRLAELKRRMKIGKQRAKENKKNGQKGDIIITKLKMMRPPVYVEGYSMIFANYKHQNRKDGYGCMRLSPKSLGPVVHNMPNLPIAKNLENFHQFAKFWKFELDEEGNIKEEYVRYREDGYKSNIPMRHKYPKSDVLKKNNKKLAQEFAMFYDQNGKERRYTYMESRYFYCHFYEKLASKENDFKKLQKSLKNGFNLNIVGYDGYHVDKSLWECYNDVRRPFGHELVLYTLLTVENPENYPWNQFYRENKELYSNVI
jgi:hypothetical protein